MSLLSASVRNFRARELFRRCHTSHPPHCTSPFSTMSSAPLSALFAHALFLERCTTLTAIELNSTTRFLTFLGKVKSAATAANRTLRDGLVTQTSDTGSEEMAAIQNPMPRLYGPSNTSRKTTETAARTRLRHHRFRLSAAIVRSSPEYSLESFLFALSAFLLPFSFGGAPLRRSARFCRHIAAKFIQVSINENVDAQEISRILMGESNDESDENQCPRTKSSISRNEQRKASAQALAPQNSLSLPSVS